MLSKADESSILDGENLARKRNSFGNNKSGRNFTFQMALGLLEKLSRRGQNPFESSEAVPTPKSQPVSHLPLKKGLVPLSSRSSFTGQHSPQATATTPQLAPKSCMPLLKSDDGRDGARLGWKPRPQRTSIGHTRVRHAMGSEHRSNHPALLAAARGEAKTESGRRIARYEAQPVVSPSSRGSGTWR